MLLLNNGADVSQVEHFPGQKVTVAKFLGPNRPNLKRMLAQLECEERVKRGMAQGLSFLNFPPLCQMKGMC